MSDTDYADEYGYETVRSDKHDFGKCPNCGSALVVENDHGTVDEMNVECAGCGRARGRPEFPTLEEIADESDVAVDYIRSLVNHERECQDCGHAWKYTGDSERPTCPSCKGKRTEPIDE